MRAGSAARPRRGADEPLSMVGETADHASRRVLKREFAASAGTRFAFFKRTRLLAALGAVSLIVGGLAASAAASPVMPWCKSTARRSRRRRSNHWLAVAASASAGAVPGQKAPKVVVPDPPAYTACIAHLKEVEPKAAKGQQPKTEAQLKTQCEQQHKALQQQVLGFLIGVDWVIRSSRRTGHQGQ